MNDIICLSAAELTKQLQSKAISASEAAKAYLDQIKKVEPQVGAYLLVTEEEALKKAEEIDRLDPYPRKW